MKITLTGADERTRIEDLVGLINHRPDVEIGLLYSRNSTDNRYPSRQWILIAAQALSGRCALHVCGRQARDELLSGDLADIVAHTPRVQVNGRLTVGETVAAAARVEMLITQHNEANPGLLYAPCENHQILVDSSGGRGITPAHWKIPDTSKQVGYAGGMGPENLNTTLLCLSMLFRGNWWVDMESKLRRNDWFDIDLASHAVAIFGLTMANTRWEARAQYDRMVLKCNNIKEQYNYALSLLSAVRENAGPELVEELDRMAKANPNDVTGVMPIKMTPALWDQINSLIQARKA